MTDEGSLPGAIRQAAGIKKERPSMTHEHGHREDRVVSGEAATPKGRVRRNRSDIPQRLRETMEEALTEHYSHEENKPHGEAAGFFPHISTRGTTILPLPVAFEDRDSDQLPFQF